MDPHATQPPYLFGAPLDTAKAAMLLVHGRGGSAEGMAPLAEAFGTEEIAYLAPRAAHQTWYPFSFLAPIEENEPGISSGIFTLKQLVDQALAAGLPTDRIFLCGFSQGACLASEFVARHPARYAGLIAFSGGLIGPEGTTRDYPGVLAGTPVFLGSSDHDAHVPTWRVHETAEVLEKMGAIVDERIYPNMPHTIIKDEIEAAKKLIDPVLATST